MKYEPKEQEYNEYVENITPKSSCMRNCIWAFFVGGSICCLGQLIFNLFVKADYDKDVASGYVSIILILISVILTSLNLYKKLAKYGGAGALVPITGFANGVCAPIVEFQTEGEIFGKGVKAFTIAGPVILYGIFASWIAGLIYWMIHLLGFLN